MSILVHSILFFLLFYSKDHMKNHIPQKTRKISAKTRKSHTVRRSRHTRTKKHGGQIFDILDTYALTDYDGEQTSAIKNQCVGIEGKFYHFRCNEECLKKLPKTVHAYTSFDSYTHKNEVLYMNGVFTWMIVRKDDQTCIVFTKVYSIQEIGTTHNELASHAHNVVFNGAAFAILGAGEFKKNKHNIVANELSGTYMFNIIEKVPSDQRSTFHNALHELFSSFFPSCHVTFDMKMGTNDLITQENIVLDKTQIQRLVNIGVQVREFESKKACDAFKKYPMLLARAQARHDQQVRASEKSGIKPPEFKEPDFEKGILL